VPVIGVVHDCQVIDEIVRADPDCLVDLIVTPTRLVRCREGGTVSELRRRRA
jgi:5-formyltetrahydrofolate cyclo-ligase